MIKWAKSTHSILGKVFEKLSKFMKDQGKKQIKAIKKKQMQDKDKDKLLSSNEIELFKNIYSKTLDRKEDKLQNLTIIPWNLSLIRVV